jgi:tape measure domain-containing protein
MAKKNIQVIYTVNDAALLKAAGSLKANEDAAKKADAATKKFGDSAKKAGEGASKSFLNLGTIWKGLIAIGITTLFVNLAKRTFELGVKQEQLNIAFTTFLGSAEKAKKLLQDLTKFAIVTPFTPDQVNNAAKALLAFGVAGKDIIPTLKMLGDVSSGTGKDLTEMAIIFGQIRSTGRLMGQDLLQLINAGFNPLQIISEKTGRSVANLKKDMEAGLITFDMVEGAFKSATTEGGLFFNLMEKQSQSVGGLLSTVSGNIDELLKIIFTANSGPIKTFSQLLVEMTEGLMAFAKTEEQWAEERDTAATERYVEQFQALAKAFTDVNAARTFAIGEIDKELEKLKEEEAQIRRTKELKPQEQKIRQDTIKSLEDEKEAIDNYIKALEKSNAEDLLKKQLIADAAAADAAKKKREELLKEILKDIKNPKEESEASIDISDLFKLTPEQEKEIEEDTKRTLERLDDLADQEFQKQVERNEKEVEEEDKKQKRIRDLKKQAFDYGLDLLEQLLMASIGVNDMTFEREKGNFDQRLANAGDNSRARMEIEAERVKFEEEQDRKAEQFENDKAKRDKERQVKQMVIQNVLNAIRAIGTPPVPNFPLALITGGFGLAQIALAKGTGFKEGVIDLQGPGTGTSDSIPARLSRGESVINAASTSRSLELLEAINDGRIDDRFLRSLKGHTGGVTVIKDNSDVVEAIERNRVDLVRHGHLIYESQKKGKNLRRNTISKYRNT